MRVNGEWLFAVNFGLDMLSLALAGRMSRVRVRWGRWTLSACLGAGYALLSVARPMLGGWLGLAASAAGMMAVAFGGKGLKILPLFLSAALLLSGALGFLEKWGVPPMWALLICCIAAAYFLRRPIPSMEDAARVRITYRGNTLSLPSLRDSGNTLHDPVTGLPVLVIPARKAQCLLPEHCDPQNISDLPPHFRLIFVKTAAGSQMMMCFHPDKVQLCQGKRMRETDAVAALSPGDLPRAIVPEALYR